MAHPYLEHLQGLTANIEYDGVELACKHFFSGAALYANGRMCASLSPVGLAFKLPGSRCKELVASAVAIPLCDSSNAPIKNGYALFPEPDDLSEPALSAYFRECIENSRRDD